MVKLTEDMVIARSKGADLHNIKKLNCWGSELTDVSVVRKLNNVEVLSLSVNKISTLEDFEHCQNLQELYIRKNNIKNINDVLYLRELPKLKSLWLNDNPCAEFDQYRLTVLRSLPHLQKLDNITVEPEEVQKAMVYGISLPKEPKFPWDDRLSSSKQTQGQQEENGGPVQYYSEVYSPNQIVSPSDHSVPVYNNHVNEDYEHVQPVYNEDDEQIDMRRKPIQHRDSRSQEPDECEISSIHNGSQTYRHSYADYEDGRRIQQQQQQLPPQQNIRRQSYSSGHINDTKTAPRQVSMRANIESDHDTEYEYRPYNRAPTEYSSSSRAPFARDDSLPTRRISRDGQAWTEDSHHLMYEQSMKRHDQLETASIRSPESPACPRTFHSRPKSRNANLLSAVLCLIKELDFNGLEVAEMAIHRRLDELD